VSAWITNFSAGWPQDSLAQSVLTSGEYLNRFGTNTQFVIGMYNDVLGRSPAQSEINGWVAQLQTGISRAAIINGFLTSFEYHYNQNALWTAHTYQTLLGRPAGANEVTAIAQALQAGVTYEQLDVNVLGSWEYYNRAAHG